MSLGSFAAAALVSLVGSSFTTTATRLPFNFMAILGLLSGTVGVGGLVFGCTMMVRETRLAIRNLAEETEIAALAVPTPVMATNRSGERASVFSIDQPEEAGANQHEPNGGRTSTWLSTVTILRKGTMEDHHNHQEIANLAYQFWLERGCPVGSSHEDWFRAERAWQSSCAEDVEADAGREVHSADRGG
jgi:hypothetical protein